ncbi:MAG: arsenate reductase ArsC [Chloroflexota bacterium]|jgi:arsenate reductase
MSKKKVLFLCTGNSCRSQMAEGLVKHYLSKEWKAYSAGTEPSGYVHPMAVQAMAELGIDIAGQESKSAEAFRSKRLDLVVTVCDDAAESCPVWLGQGEVAHISFPDPAKATGTEEERMEVFRSVRDDICRRVFYYLANGRVLIPGFAG